MLPQEITQRETGNDTQWMEALDLPLAINTAASIYATEATRKNLDFSVSTKDCPKRVRGDRKKIETLVGNLIANGSAYSNRLSIRVDFIPLCTVKYTEKGSVEVVCREMDEPRDAIFAHDAVVIEITVTDTGSGMSPNQLGSMFRQLEQVERVDPTRDYNGQGVGKNDHRDLTCAGAHRRL
jgi:signal transduction histidine kinase